MPTQQKADTIAKIKEEFGSAAGVILVDYKSLTVKQAEQVRRELREKGAEMKVYKNTLARIALSELGLPTMDDLLTGPSAFIIAKDDPAAPAKSVKNFASDLKTITIKGGLVDGRVVTTKEVEAIAELPSREHLVGMLIGALQSPFMQLCRVITGPNDQIVRALNEVLKQKEAA